MKKIFRMAIVCALAGAALLTGCTKDWTTEVNKLQEDVKSLTTQVDNLQKLIDKGYIITAVTPTATGVDITYVDSKGTPSVVSLKNGENGVGSKGDNGQGCEVEINADGYWVIKTIDKNGNVTTKVTDYKAKGEDGTPGKYWDLSLDPYQWVEYEWKDGKYVATGKTMEVFPDGFAPLTAKWVDGVIEFGNVDGYEGDEPLKLDLRASLTSIVTIPQLYYGGIEALRYARMYNPELTIDGDADGFKDDEDQDVWIEDLNEPTPEVDIINSPSGAYAEYWVNPLRYDIANAEWNLWGEDYLYLKKAGWTPRIKEDEDGNKRIERRDDNRVRVYYEIDDIAALNPNNDVSVMQLIGTDSINGNAEVYSDLAAIVPLRDSLKALAFLPNTYTTENPCNIDIDPALELYEKAEDAARNVHSVPVQYNGGHLALDFIGVHMFDAKQDDYDKVDDTSEHRYTMDELNAIYETLELRYEFVPCKLGTEVTPEQNFGKFADDDNDGKIDAFVPCFADRRVNNGDPVEITVANAEDPQGGRSALGRKPIVLVTLVDTANDDAIVLAGYFKIKIVEDAPVVNKTDKTFEIKDFDADDELIKISCGIARLRTIWIDMSYPILEEGLNMSYAEFRKDFVWDGDTYVKTGVDATTGLNTYAKIVPGSDNDYGTITYIEDGSYDPTKDQSGINDVFEVTVTRDQALRIKEDKGGEVTLYARFRGPFYVYVGLTVHVGDFASLVDVQKKIEKYWFDVIDGYQTTVYENVLVPNDWKRGGTQDDVTVYIQDLDNAWEIPAGEATNRPVITIDPADAYDGEPGQVKYEYVFPKEANQNIDVLGYGTKWKWENKTTLSYNGEDVITLQPDGRIQYLCNETAKKLLNYEYPLYSDVTSEILYCKVAIHAYYEEANPAGTQGECVDDLGYYTYNVRFLRPVEFEPVSPKSLVDAVPTGSYITIGNLFGAKDWQGFKIFERDEDETHDCYGMYVPCYFWDDFTAVRDYTNYRIEWYGYYGFESFNIKVEDAETDLSGERKLLREVSEVNVHYLLYVAKKDAVDTPITGDIAINNVDDATYDRPVIPNLEDYVLFYWNDRGVVQAHNLWVPVSIKYAWGEYTTMVQVPVRATSDFDPNDPFL